MGSAIQTLFIPGNMQGTFVEITQPEMNPSLVMSGKVYVFRVKSSEVRDWNAPDLAYGLAHEGGDSLCFSGFKELSIKKNKRDFVTKKANANDAQCTGADMMKTLNDWKPIGDPVLTFEDKPVTWYDLAKKLYSAGIFTNSDAYNQLEAVANAVNPGGTATESPASMLAKVKNQAEQLAKNSPCPSFTKSLSQAGRFLTNTGFAIDKLDREELVKMVEEFKIRAVLAEEKCLALETEAVQKDSKIDNLETDAVQKDSKIGKLEEKLKAIKIELDSSKKAQAGFMAMSDMKAMETEIMKKSSTSLLDSLKPMLVSELHPLKQSLDTLVLSLTEIKTSCSDIPSLHNSLAQLASASEGNAMNVMSHIETSETATMEVLMSIKDTMGSSSPKKAVPPSTTPVHEGLCSYQLVPGVPGALRCTLGCSSTLNSPSSFSVAFPPNQFLTPPPFTSPSLGVPGGSGGNAAVGRGVANAGGAGVRGARGRGKGGGRGRGATADDFGNEDNFVKKKTQRFRSNAKKSLQHGDDIASMKQQLAELQQKLQLQNPK